MYGLASMTAPLCRVALRRPGPALLGADAKAWHYGPSFDPTRVQDEHAAFAALLESKGCELLWMSGDDAGIADSVFTYDASLMTPEGAILMSPGKTLRRGEERLHRQFYEAYQIPILGAVQGEARAEAGDSLWLDNETLVIGLGFRTNPEGRAQIAKLVEPLGIKTPTFDLPVYGGADACLHLMSLISLVDDKKALVCKPLLPVGLWRLLLDKGFEIIEAPYDEFESSGTLSLNVLATAPGEGIMIDGLPKTRAVLEEAGIALSVYPGEALCVGCEGGPTCLTRPVLRAH